MRFRNIIIFVTIIDYRSFQIYGHLQIAQLYVHVAVH